MLNKQTLISIYYINNFKQLKIKKNLNLDVILVNLNFNPTKLFPRARSLQLPFASKR